MSVGALQMRRRDKRIQTLEAVEKSRGDYAAFSRVVSAYLALPALRAFWPMSSVAYTNPQGIDLSSQPNDLTNNNSADFGYDGLAPMVTFDGVNQYLSRADGGAANWADITGTETYVSAAQRGLTMYTWIKPGLLATAQHIIGKWGAAGQRSYRLLQSAGNTVTAQISVDGTAVVSSTSMATLSLNTWYFLCLQFEPSTELSVWVNTEKTPIVAGIPASIFDSTSAFTIGASAAPGSYLTGSESNAALCAAWHDDTHPAAVFQQSRAMYGV